MPASAQYLQRRMEKLEAAGAAGEERGRAALEALGQQAQQLGSQLAELQVGWEGGECLGEQGGGSFRWGLVLRSRFAGRRGRGQGYARNLFGAGPVAQPRDSSLLSLAGPAPGAVVHRGKRRAAGCGPGTAGEGAGAGAAGAAAGWRAATHRALLSQLLGKS